MTATKAWLAVTKSGSNDQNTAFDPALSHVASDHPFFVIGTTEPGRAPADVSARVRVADLTGDLYEP